MSGPTVPTPRQRPRMRFTIGGLMLTIAGTAVFLAVLKPLASFTRAIYPDLARVFERLSSFETWAVISCLAIGIFSAVRLMQEDEKT